MKNDQLYLTWDLGQAAFLCLMGYTLLGATDSGEKTPAGKVIYNFGITHTELKNQPGEMKDDILQKLRDYDTAINLFDNPKRTSFKEYSMKIHMCNRALRYPVTEDVL